MNKSLVSSLACPSCRCSYELICLHEIEDRIETAALVCPSCQIAVPVCHGFPLFPEARFYPVNSLDGWLDELTIRLFGDESGYAEFLEEKSRRGSTDQYAAFQPFNESTRSIYPFLSILQQVLRPGDVILDTWCRTGWSGELLAGLFPRQRIVSIWEGNSNVLGYRGFHHWLGSQERASNLDIIFTHPDHPLPLRSGSIALVHGLDSLHRYRHASFIPESLRVCREDGILLFPHVHLTNSQPEPFFERGCQQYHGQEWKGWLDRLLAGSGRTAWILPEAELFGLAQSRPLHDDCQTSHYNALILLAPRELEGAGLRPLQHLPLRGDSRFTRNPLLEIALDKCQVKHTGKELSGTSASLLSRHPCYAAHLSAHAGQRLEIQEALFIWHADQCLALDEIAAAMGLEMPYAQSLAMHLCNRELLHSAPISRSMAGLQAFYGFSILPKASPACFASLWQAVPPAFDKRPLICWLEDGSEFNYDDVAYLVNGIRQRLAQEVAVGQRIAIAASYHPEALLLCWACWLNGITVVPLEESLPALQINKLLERTNAALLFTTRPELAIQLGSPVVLLDGDDARPEDSSVFSEWLGDDLDADPVATEALPDAIAVILFTSGSTGEPKGVMLSQRALCASGHNMALTHRWRAEILLSLGRLSMMSGLRNPALSALISGSTILVPSRATSHHPLVAWEQAASYEATVITTVPAWLQMLLDASEITPAPRLRQILVTGAPLGEESWARAVGRLGCGVGNYYGLTETGGLCAAALPDEPAAAGTIGYARGALLQVVDTCGQPVGEGEEGELRCYSRQLMSGYLDDPVASAIAIRDGWLYTGDRARWNHAGQLVLLGRADDRFKLRCGTLFYPGEIESLLIALPGVADAAVTLDGTQQRLVALLVTDRPPEEIMAEVIEKYSDRIARNQIPERWLRVAGLPRGVNGKLQRFELGNLADLPEPAPDCESTDNP